MPVMQYKRQMAKWPPFASVITASSPSSPSSPYTVTTSDAYHSMLCFLLNQDLKFLGDTSLAKQKYDKEPF